MRDEDLDWEIYRLIADGEARRVADLAAAGRDPALVEEALGRLERYHLIDRAGDTMRVLSVQESLLLCRAENDESCPFVVENGVIRVRKKEDRGE